MYYLLLFSVLTSIVVSARQSVLQTPDKIEPYVISTCGNFTNYAALGDSYSVGLRSDTKGNLSVCPTQIDNGLAPYCTIECCAKNYGAYAWLFAQSHPRANFQFLACSGANSTRVNENQTMQWLRNTTDLVTITVGGDNGNAFARIVKYCVYVKIEKECQNAFQNANEVLSYAQSNLTLTLNTIKQYSPHAQINVLSYVQFWSSKMDPSQCPTIYLRGVSAVNMALMNSLVRQVNGNNSLAVTAFNKANGNNSSVSAAFIDVDTSFNNFRLCDTTPYLQYEVVNFTMADAENACGQNSDNDVWPRTGVFHPNELGQQAYLRTLSTSLGC